MVWRWEEMASKFRSCVDESNNMRFCRMGGDVQSLQVYCVGGGAVAVVLGSWGPDASCAVDERKFGENYQEEGDAVGQEH